MSFRLIETFEIHYIFYSWDSVNLSRIYINAIKQPNVHPLDFAYDGSPMVSIAPKYNRRCRDRGGSYSNLGQTKVDQSYLAYRLYFCPR